MSRSYEGDLIRPLGLVTLYFGYAEAEVIRMLELLRDAGVVVDVPPVALKGQRIAALVSVVQGLPCASRAEVLGILEEAKSLFERRNAREHLCARKGGSQ